MLASLLTALTLGMLPTAERAPWCTLLPFLYFRDSLSIHFTGISMADTLAVTAAT